MIHLLLLPSQPDSGSLALPPTGRGRVRSVDFGMPERQGLIDLARTYLETQARPGRHARGAGG